MGHDSMQTTLAYYRVTEKRVRSAVEDVSRHQFDGQGRPVLTAVAGLLADEHTRLRVGQVAALVCHAHRYPGVVDWPSWLRLLRDLRYKGWAVFELDAAHDPVADLKQIKQYVEAALAPIYR